MDALSTRILLSAFLGLLLALLSVPSRLSSYRPHPLCTLHPSLTAFCLRFHRSFPSSASNLTVALAAIPSPSGSEFAVLEYAAFWLSAHGFVVKRQPLPPLSAGGKPRENVLALWGSVKPQDVLVLLCTHLDVVPGHGRPPGAPACDGSILRGRGTADAKGQAAGMMLALHELRDSRVGLLLLAGEETDHAGMLAASELGFGEHVVIVNGEPTESRLATVQKGMARVVVRVKGRAAHSGYPELGESAVDKLVDLLGELRGMAWPERDGEKTTMNVGVLNGGVAPNVVAADAEAGILFRLIGEPEEVLSTVRRVASGYGNVSVEVLTSNGPVSFLVPPRVASELGTTSVAYNTDVPYYRRKYKAAVLFGAGSITTAHTEDEFVDVGELELLPGRLKAIVEEVLVTDGP